MEKGFFAFLSVLYTVFSIIRCFSSSWKSLLAVRQRPGLWTPSGKFRYGTSEIARQSEWKLLLLLYSSKWLVKLAHKTQCTNTQRCPSYLSSGVVDVTACWQTLRMCTTSTAHCHMRLSLQQVNIDRDTLHLSPGHQTLMLQHQSWADVTSQKSTEHKAPQG